MKKLIALAALAIMSTSAFASRVLLDRDELPNCKGHIKVSVSDNGQRNGEQINISAGGLMNCSKMVVEDEMGRVIAWGKKRDHQLDLNPTNKPKGPYGGSGTIPQDNLYPGFNSFYVVIKSNGKTQDRFLVSGFLVLPNSSGSTTVIPSFPAPSSGSSGSGGGI